jgi:hypothetical protein
MIANANDATLFDLRSIAAPAEEVFKRAGIREGSDAARLVAKALDGQIPEASLTPPLRRATGELRQLYRRWADIFDVDPERRISQYYFRLFERQSADTVMPELLSLIRWRPGASKIPLPGFQKGRTGAEGFIEDAVTSTRAYLMAGIRHKNLAEPLKVMNSLLKDIPMKKNTAGYLRFWMSRIVGTPDAFEAATGSLMKSAAASSQAAFGILPRVGPVKSFLAAMDKAQKLDDFRLGRAALSGGRDLYYKGALGLAPGSAFQNLTQSLNTFAEVGPRFTAAGYRDLLRLGASRELREALRQSGILADANWRKVVGEIPSEIRNRLGDFTMFLFQGAEMKNRVVGFFAGRARALARGASPTRALQEGRDVSLRTQFRYDSASTPLFFQTAAGRVAFQLGQFGIRQAEFLRPITTTKKIAKGVRALTKGQAKEARDLLLDQDVKRMVRYIMGTEAVIQAGYAIDADLRPWLRPVYFDPSRPGILGTGLQAGTAIIPLGPTIQFGTSVAEAFRGAPGSTREVLRGAQLLVPGGRAAFQIAPRVKRARTRAERIREAFSLRRAPRRRGQIQRFPLAQEIRRRLQQRR